MTVHKVGGGSGKPRACLTLTEAWLDTLRADLTHWQEVCYAHEAELQCLRAENARLRAALYFYSGQHDVPNDGPWGVDSNDFGRVARAALSGEVKP